MSEVHLRIKIGVAEVEVVAEEAFVLKHLSTLISQVVSENGWANIKENAAIKGGGGGEDSDLDQSTNTIASITNAKTGPDLAMAASAHLSLVKNQQKFSRKEILDEMQSAAAYYQQNYSGNLTKILQSLMKAKKLNLVANQTYSLPKSQVEFFTGILQEE